MKNLLQLLEERGFIEDKTSSEVAQLLEKPVTLYVGFDPTSDSLHLGNLVGLIALAWFQRFGHRPIALIGGATGMIGDPSGKSVERNLLDKATLQKNIEGIRRSLAAVLKEEVQIVNNYDWFFEISFIDFLRDVGKQFRLSTMLGKESVRTRLASEEGMSFTEFSYQLLQAYDFLYLYDHFGVVLQMGGSDQWGNITAGTELIRKTREASAYGVTFPLLTRSDGKKFGKTEEGAIWLNADKFSAYDFYQYFYKIPDQDLPKLFRMLTFLELDEIAHIERQMQEKSYIPNTAQRRLAEEVTRIVHGEGGVEEAWRLTQAAMPGGTTLLDRPTLQALAAEGSRVVPRSEALGRRLSDLLVSTGLLESKSEAKRMILGGGLYLNNEKVVSEHAILDEAQIIEGEFLLIGLGKKRKVVLRMI